MKFSDYNFANILLDDRYRNKSSFDSELWSLIIDNILPVHYQPNDARNLILKKRDDFLDELDKQIQDPGYDQESWETAVLRIRQDAEIVFNDLANIINGEQQNIYIKKRFALLEIDSIYLSGMPNNRSQREKIREQLENLKEHLSRIRSSYGEHGTTVHLAYRVEKLYADIELGKQLLRIIDDQLDANEVLTLMRDIIRANQRSRGIWKFVKEKLELILLVIVEHNSRTGDKYIASNVRDYLDLFRSALLGGVLISIFGFAKIRMESLGISLFGEGLLFSINYALCFILVDMLGGVIATKQPAMTANTLTSIINPGEEKNILPADRFSELVADASKSQFVSLVGNVLIAWLLSVLFSHLYWHYSGREILDASTANYLLDKNNVFQSGALCYAAIAGVFLSLSGLISGYISNAVLYCQLDERFKKKYQHRPNSYKVAQFVTSKLSKIVGNGTLGFFLGMSGAIGLFTGLPFDIRHVAFSSSHIGYGEAALHVTWSLTIGMQMLISILLIGFVNFVVSFHLTALMAMRARQVAFSDIRRGVGATLLLFVRRPWVFLVPIKSSFQEETR